MQRRVLLKGLVLGGVTLAVPLGGRALRAEDQRGQHQQPGAPDELGHGARAGQAPWELVAPLAAGTYVGCGWTVRSLSRVKRGAAALTLAHRSGERAELHVCRRSGLPRGIAHTGQLELFLMNGGDGQRPTAEGIGRAAKTVALRIARSERRSPRSPSTPAGLLSHQARLQLFGAPEAVA
jgi:hypothetical protein